MKKSLFLMPLMAALALTGCSNEEPLSQENFDQSFDGRAYMRVRIAMSDGSSTRADNDFVNGTEDEQAIKEIGMKFYNSDGSFYGYGVPVEDPQIIQDNTDPNIEAKVKDAVIVLQINSNAPKPTHVVAFANCGDDWKQTPEPNINDIDKTKLGYSHKYEVQAENGSTTEKEFYSMTSSNFLSTAAGAATFVQGYQTVIDPTKFKSSAEEAVKEPNPVDIYVERLAAKVKVNQAADMPNAEIQNGDYTLQFVVDGYALGGTNTQSYLIKHIDSQWNATTLWNGWNNLDYHRCYWAADMNYYETNAIPDLDYVSYEEVRNHLTTGDKWLYSPENTQTSFGNEQPRTPNTGETSTRFTTADVNRYLFQEFAYVIGHYVVKKNGVELNGTDNPYLFEYAGKILPYESMLIFMQQTLGNVVYSKDTNTSSDTYSSVNMVDKGWLKISSYNNDASLVCLHLNESVTDAELQQYYIKVPKTTGRNEFEYVQIQSKAEVEELLKQSTVQAYGFKYDGNCANTGNGGYLAYFPVLIKHLNTTGSGAMWWGEDSRGYYGVVRNHCYNITINKITGLGIGIYDPDVDIIPKDKIKPLYLAASFNILSWRLVNHTVDL